MMDWDHLQSFLAVARLGNLSAAARSLKVRQTTKGRRLDALHARAGTRLLQKTPSGFVMTPVGERILASVERIELETLSVERAIAGEDERIAGEVRITTVDSFGARIITPMLQQLSHFQPGLSIELIADSRSLSLSRREADIAALSSGNVVHNLREIDWKAGNQGEPWAHRFDDAATEMIEQRPGDLASLAGHPDYHRAAPTPDHFVPLLYTAGVAALSGGAKPLLRGYALGSLSMTSYGIGVGDLGCDEGHSAATLPRDVPPDQTNI